MNIRVGDLAIGVHNLRENPVCVTSEPFTCRGRAKQRQAATGPAMFSISALMSVYCRAMLGYVWLGVYFIAPLFSPGPVLADVPFQTSGLNCKHT